jgi:hypothetical protein
MSDISEFLSQYVKTALWSSTDDNGSPLDDVFDEDSIDPATKQEMLRDCDRFMRLNKKLLDESGLDIDQQAHNFWLDRNGHGTGFWDVDDYKNPEAVRVGKALSQACKKFGSYDLYVGDDGYIHGSGGNVTKQSDRYSEAEYLEALANHISKLNLTTAQPANPRQIIVEIQKALESLGNAPYRETMDYYLGREMQQIDEYLPVLKRTLTKINPGAPLQQKPSQQPKPQDWMASRQVKAAPPSPMPPNDADKRTTLKVLQKIKQDLMRLGESDLLDKLKSSVGTDFKKLVELSQMIGTAIQRLQTR